MPRATRLEWYKHCCVSKRMTTKRRARVSSWCAHCTKQVEALDFSGLQVICGECFRMNEVEVCVLVEKVLGDVECCTTERF